jgi:hypothetical protein
MSKRDNKIEEVASFIVCVAVLFCFPQIIFNAFKVGFFLCGMPVGGNRIQTIVLCLACVFATLFAVCSVIRYVVRFSIRAFTKTDAQPE